MRRSTVSRRDFMMQASAGAAMLALTGPSSKAEAAALPFSIGSAPLWPGPTGAASPEILDEFAALNVRRMSELDRLPWFETNEEGLLALRADAGLLPIIDMHSHLGWSYGLGRSIDMGRHCEVEFFYDYEADQDLLFNQEHPTEEEGKTVTLECLGVVFHTPKRNRTHTAANLCTTMDRMGYQNIVLLPIEIPKSRRHARETLQASRMDERLTPFGAVYPYPWNRKKRAILKEQIAEYGIKGIKLHPEFQAVRPDEKACMEMFEWCAEHDLIVFAHVGYTGTELKFMRDYAEPDRFVPALEAFPELRIVLGHTGVRRIDETLAVARRFEEQVWLGISGQPANNIAYILERYNNDRILYGSDWPFMPLEVMLARTLIATEGHPETRDKVLHHNAAQLMGWA